MEHKPGPWTYKYNVTEFRIYSGNEHIAETYLSGPSDEANARLIAAAPELLVALENLMESYENRMGDWENADFNEVYRVARDVVAKAKGEVVEHDND